MRRAVVLICLSLAFVNVRTSAAETLQFRTYVTPNDGETLSGNCIYQMTIPDTGKPVNAVFVIFERGWQVGNVYYDPTVFRFAQRLQLALVLAQHCPAKASQDIDVVPEHGIGRALESALDQFARLSNHPELSRSKLILFSFSGGGSLVARMVNYIPERTIAAIEYAPGHYDPVGIDTVVLTPSAAQVPQLMIANGADDRCGTARPYGYFAAARTSGAPVTFVIQNRTPHCCISNVLPLILDWLEPVIHLRVPDSANLALHAIDLNSGWFGVIKVRDSGVREKNPAAAKVWDAVSAEVYPTSMLGRLETNPIEIARTPKNAEVPATGTLIPCWLPSRRFAQEWASFVGEPEHPVTPLE